MDGILVINKDPGMTSHDVVMALRRLLKEPKIGHTGTLDPEVSGVLVMCIGKATKLIPLMENETKTYVATARIGIKTDTQDIHGNVLEKTVVEKLTNEEVDHILGTFMGEGSQIPPMYSAVKVKGKKLYEYARKGIEVKREARPIFIHDIKRISHIMIEQEQATFTFIVTSDKGLYVRTLIEDIGQRLNYPATMDHLVRIQSGSYHLDQSVTLSQIKEGHVPLVSLESLLSRYPSVILNDYMIRLVENGVVLDERQATFDCPFVVKDKTGQSVALYQPIKEHTYHLVIKLR